MLITTHSSFDDDAGAGTYVVIVLLHGYHPRNVIKGDGAETEVGVIGDLGDFFDEGVEVRGRDAVDGGDEIGGCEAVLVRGRAAALLLLVHAI